MDFVWILFILFGVTIALFVLVSKVWASKEGESNSEGAYSAQTHGQFMPGLQRADIEDELNDTNRWECGVCAFSNVEMKTTCSLCGTAKESGFVELANDEIDYTLLKNRPRSKSYRDPSILLSMPRMSSALATMSSRGRKSKMAQHIQRMSSFFFHKLVLPNDLSARQRSARMRKEWVRKLDTKERPYWKRRILDANHVPLAYLVQICSAIDRQDLLERERQSSFLNTLEEDEAIAVLEGGSVADEEGGDGLEILAPPDNGEAKHLMYIPVDSVNANRSVLGEPVDPALWRHLHMLSRLPFSTKYTWYLHQADTILVPYEKGHCKMRVARDYVFDEALENILHLKEQAFCVIIRMQFKGESGLDAGAIQREWYLLVAQGFMDDASGLFMLTNRDDNSYFINPNSEYLLRRRRHDLSSHLVDVTHLQAYRAAGRFIGRALLDGQMLPMHFSPVLFKLLLGIPVTMDDVESLDPTIYSSLRYLLDNEDVENLCLTFSATEHLGESVVEVDLIENGRDIPVTDANKHEYVELMTRWLLFGRIQHQLHEMIQGLYEIIPPELLIPFDHKEFELILCGLTEIDVYDWKANTVTSSNLHESLALEWFWEIVQAMQPQDQAKLLQYSTGSSRVPVQGFKGLTSYDGKICFFTLKGVAYTPGAYPCAHACYNRIDLPIYPSKDLMQEALNMLLLSDPTGFNIE
ncbi:unnamed protein product [Aphanomyces euteiches]|uniref:HECT-type E3 ubiquitin transferase n=1 Tax=Aphanomyces euteiches TaxID=100861 RepID=A0A6G0W9A4_9STRA|nr:hypothetical protein Ae201684_017277 [Aphanomyces euteiches]KAH9081075.1 hypothetical protein Ae201684P_012048 [Aphanomyces euteiches]KAH9144940.1 hypothetical protein AeRB84_011113 [Aphanomyces euteiches]